MSSGHMLLSIAGVFLLSNLILNVHKANTERMLSIYTSESVIDASGLAQSILDEIQTKAFDEKTTTSAVSVTDSLTSVNKLGPDSGELINTGFDDIDDYNNFSTTIVLDRMGAFAIKVNVTYVNTLNPQTKSNSPTFSKHVQVAVTNYSLLDTLKFDHIISY